MSVRNSELGPKFNVAEINPALEYIDRYWKKLERFSPHDDGTLVGLPRPYFVPSVDSGTGHHFEEIYYWDTYFIAQGLLGTHREHMVRGLCDDLLALMTRFHIIPNSNRTYHTAHSQAPFLTSMIMLVYQIERNKRWLDNAMSIAKEEYRTVWMGVGQPNWRQVFHGLSRFYDINVLDDFAELESGWDMTTRFMRQALSYIPIDLNAQLYKYEKDFEEAALILGQREEAAEWAKRALQRKTMINKYLWSEKEGFYFDYNYMTGKHSPVWSLAGYAPMWAGMVDADTAARMVRNLDKFEYEGGLSCTAELPKVDTPLKVQWAWPNGWAPLHINVAQALERYDYHVEAERVARKWLKANLVQFEKRGVFLEKYNVVQIEDDPADGVYPSHVGFGWTNAVFERFCQRYLSAEEMPVFRETDQISPLTQLVKNPRHTLRKVGVKLNFANAKRLS